jgi:hypothetical protein
MSIYLIIAQITGIREVKIRAKELIKTKINQSFLCFLESLIFLILALIFLFSIVCGKELFLLK